MLKIACYLAAAAIVAPTQAERESLQGIANAVLELAWADIGNRRPLHSAAGIPEAIRVIDDRIVLLAADGTESEITATGEARERLLKALEPFGGTTVPLSRDSKLIMSSGGGSAFSAPDTLRKARERTDPATQRQIDKYRKDREQEKGGNGGGDGS